MVKSELSLFHTKVEYNCFDLRFISNLIYLNQTSNKKSFIREIISGDDIKFYSEKSIISLKVERDFISL